MTEPEENRLYLKTFVHRLLNLATLDGNESIAELRNRLYGVHLATLAATKIFETEALCQK